MNSKNLENVEQDLIEKVKANLDWYKDVVLLLVIVKEKGKNVLYRGKATFRHRSEEDIPEITHDYGNVILARRIISHDEFFDLLKDLSSQEINIRDLKSLYVGKGFDHTVFHIPSKTHYVVVIYEWPSLVYHYPGDRNFNVESKYNYLVKPTLPTYASLIDATNSFLNIKETYYDNQPFGIQFIVPDYRARIKSLVISENHLDIETECNEASFDDLILKLNCKNKDSEFIPNDIQIKDKTTINLPFVATEMYLFLVDKNDGKVIDYIEYGNYLTERHEDIIIKTSAELVESLIIKGENNKVELKREMSDEFLESVSAFANTDGGKIILGIDNRRNVIGIFEDFTNLEKRIRGTISGRCEPKIEVNVEQIEVQNKPLVVVTIPEGNNKPYLVDGTAYIRINEDDEPMGRAELDDIYSHKKHEIPTREGL